MQKQKSLPVQKIDQAMNRLGLEHVDTLSRQSRVWVDPASHEQIQVSVHQGRCYVSNLQNALQGLSKESASALKIRERSQRLMSGDLNDFSDNAEKVTHAPASLPSLPRTLANRNLSRKTLEKTLIESGWDMIAQHGSHSLYQPPVDGFRGQFSFIHHGGRKEEHPALQTQKYLRILMKMNPEPEAQKAITVFHDKFVKALEVN